jgi:hypothetical protein
MNNPSPVPSKDFVANFENNLGKISESMPVPLSFILTVVWLSFFSEIIDIFPPSPLVNLIALLRRLKITCDNLSLSAFRTIGVPIVGVEYYIGKLDMVSKVLQVIMIGMSVYLISTIRKTKIVESLR